MDFDELKLAWEITDQKLDRTIRLNQQLVISAKLNRVRTPLRRLTWSLSVEAILAFGMLLGLGSFIFAHTGQARFAWPAALLDVWTIALLAGTIWQIVFIVTTDYNQPVVEVQRRIEELRLLRLRILRLALITGPVVWCLPFLVVAFKAFSGVDAYQAFGYRFFYVNGAVSGVAIPLLIWLSKMFTREMEGSRFFRKVVGYVEGNYIDAALSSIAAITAFESEEVGAGA